MSDYEYSDEEEYHYSDDDDEVMMNSDNDGDDHGSNNSDQPISMKIENLYYTAKQFRDDEEFNEAIEKFEEVLMEESQQNWCFKALKQLVKLQCRLLSDQLGSSSSQNSPMSESSDNTGDDKGLVGYYKRLLDFIVTNKESLSPSEVEKGVNSILERIGSLVTIVGNNSSNSQNNVDVYKKQLVSVYELTLQVFRPSTYIPNDSISDDQMIGSEYVVNDRLWFKTNLKLGQLLCEMKETEKMQMLIQELLAHQEEQFKTQSEMSSSASTQMLEIYALQIQLYSMQKDGIKLREVFVKAMKVEGGIPHPRTLALIQELGGKMHMEAGEYEMATKTFFQAFKSYDEAGDMGRLRCLKYLVLASMLEMSDINPFDSQEALSYKDNAEIKAMTDLVSAFQSNQIKKFEYVLKQNEDKIAGDEFMMSYITDLLRKIRSKVLVSTVGPYKRVSLKRLSEALNYIPIEEVESILVSLILEGDIAGRIDQVQGVLIMSNGGSFGESSNVQSTGSLECSTLEQHSSAAIDQLADALKHLTFSLSRGVESLHSSHANPVM